MVPGMHPGEYRVRFLGRQPADRAIGAVVHLLDQERAPGDGYQIDLSCLCVFHFYNLLFYLFLTSFILINFVY